MILIQIKFCPLTNQQILMLHKFQTMLFKAMVTHILSILQTQFRNFKANCLISLLYGIYGISKDFLYLFPVD